MGVGFISEKRHPTTRSWSLINGRLAARLATASARQSAKDRMPEGRRCERGQGRWPLFPVVFKNAGLRIDWLGHGRLARFRLIRNYGGCHGNSSRKLRKLPETPETPHHEFPRISQERGQEAARPRMAPPHQPSNRCCRRTFSIGRGFLGLGGVRRRAFCETLRRGCSFLRRSRAGL